MRNNNVPMEPNKERKKEPKPMKRFSIPTDEDITEALMELKLSIDEGKFNRALYYKVLAIKIAIDQSPKRYFKVSHEQILGCILHDVKADPVRWLGMDHLMIPNLNPPAPGNKWKYGYY